jgi:PmbA protein
MFEKDFQFIFDYAADKVDDIEIYLTLSNAFSVRINQQEVEDFKYADANGLSVRVIIQGVEGYAYTERLDEEAYKMIVDEAITNCAFTDSDDEVILSDYPAAERDVDEFNPALEEVTVEEKIAFAKQVERIARDADSRILNIPMTVLANGKRTVKIANSKGLNKEDTGNYIYAYTGVLAGNEEEKRMAYEMAMAKDFSKLSAQDMADKAVKQTLDLLDSKPTESGEYPVVLNNKMMAEMLGTFAGVFSAKAVQEGRSLFKDKLNTRVANEKITIIDDGLYPGGFATSAFDGEGYPSMTTKLIDKGILSSYLHNTATARKDGVQSTGNASRSYKGSVEITTSNFYLEPGTTPLNELFKAHERIIEIVSLQGLHSGANTISGDFSLSGEGFLWENGVRQHSLKPFTVSGNFVTMLNAVEALGDNFEFNMSSFGAPSVLISSLAISG